VFSGFIIEFAIDTGVGVAIVGDDVYARPGLAGVDLDLEAVFEVAYLHDLVAHECRRDVHTVRYFEISEIPRLSVAIPQVQNQHPKHFLVVNVDVVEERVFNQDPLALAAFVACVFILLNLEFVSK